MRLCQGGQAWGKGASSSSTMGTTSMGGHMVGMGQEGTGEGRGGACMGQGRGTLWDPGQEGADTQGEQ